MNWLGPQYPSHPPPRPILPMQNRSLWAPCTFTEVESWQMGQGLLGREEGNVLFYLGSESQKPLTEKLVDGMYTAHCAL